MRGRFSFLQLAAALVSAAFVAVLVVSGASCGTSTTAAPPSGRPLTVAPSLVWPQGDIVGEVAAFKLTIYAAPTGVGDAGAVCNTSTGAVTGNLGAPLDGTPTSKASMSGCDAGDSRCFTGLKIVQSGVPFVFSVIGYSDSAETMPLAQGCTTTTIDGGDAEGFTAEAINMYPIMVAAVCSGSSTVTPPQTCNDPPPTMDAGPPVCVSCQTVEEVLSTGTGSVDGGSITLTGNPGDKTYPSFVWPAGVGEAFYAFFGDTSSGASHISMRVKSGALGDTPVFGSQSFYLPTNPSGKFPPTFPTTTPDGGSPVAHNQQQPAAVEANGNTYVAFADDSATPGTFAIFLRSYDASLIAQTAAPCPVSTVTGSAAAGETGSLSAPAIAVAYPAGAMTAYLLIGWQDDRGNVYTRAYLPNTSGGCGTPEEQALISTTSSSSQVSITGIPGDFIAVWKSGSDVMVRSVGLTGNPAPKSQHLELANHVASFPSVASITNGANVSAGNLGSFAVVWADEAPGAGGVTTIYGFRFNMTQSSIDDAPSQVSTTASVGGETTPVIVPSPTALGSYVVVWADQGSNNQIRARYLNSNLGQLGVQSAPAASSAYLLNPVDGTTNDFPVGVLPSRTRVTPTVVVGGGDTHVSPYVAFGWVDTTASPGYGIVARRFPAPQ